MAKKPVSEGLVEDGVTVTISKAGGKTVTMTLCDFLKLFLREKQQDAFCIVAFAALHRFGKIPKTKDELRAKEYEIRKDPKAHESYWNGDDWGSISGYKDAEKWVEGELEKFKNS